MVKQAGSITKVGVSISNWVFEEAGISGAKNKSKRMEELLIKGMMFEKEKALNTELKVSNSDYRTMGL